MVSVGPACVGALDRAISHKGIDDCAELPQCSPLDGGTSDSDEYFGDFDNGKPECSEAKEENDGEGAQVRVMPWIQHTIQRVLESSFGVTHRTGVEALELEDEPNTSKGDVAKTSAHGARDACKLKEVLQLQEAIMVGIARQHKNGPDGHVYFQLQVHVGMTVCKCWKRYSQLRQFHAELELFLAREKVGWKKTPKSQNFPPKLWTASESNIAERSRQLDAYFAERLTPRMHVVDSITAGRILRRFSEFLEIPAGVRDTLRASA